MYFDNLKNHIIKNQLDGSTLITDCKNNKIFQNLLKLKSSKKTILFTSFLEKKTNYFFLLILFTFLSACDYNKTTSLQNQQKKDSINAQFLFDEGVKLAANKEYIESFKLLDKGKDLIKKHPNSDLNWLFLAQIGFLQTEIGNYTDAKTTFKEALKYSESNRQFITTYSNISASFNSKRLDSSIYYLKKALNYCTDKEKSNQCLITYNNLSYRYLELDKPDLALEVFNQNINIDQLDKSNSNRIYPSCMHTLGDIYFYKKEYKKSIQHLDSALVYFAHANDINSVIQTKKSLSNNYENLGDYKKSVLLLKEIDELKEDLNKNNLKKEIAKIEANNLIEAKENEINNLGEAMSKTKLISIILLLALLTILVVFIFRLYKNKIKFHVLNEALSVSRLKSLRAAMNPHFLFNSFNTLQNYILKEDQIKANEYMTELSELIRETLTSSDSIFHSLEKEIKILKSYINLEQGRFSNKFETKFEIDKSLLKSNIVIPSMIIQPHVENAILHGFSSNKSRGKLLLSFKKENNTIVCKIKDNGIGRKKAQKLKKDSTHLSIATKNTNERLDILNKINKQDSNIEIKDLFDNDVAVGTLVKITLPISK